MNVLMIDTDSKFGNLYLMQLSAWHKAQGDKVSMVEQGEPDKVYISSLFTKTRGRALGIARRFTCPVVLGGTGINLEHGDYKIATLKPDYDLYPSKEAMGRTTWGCPRKCPWCVVPRKEGRFSRWTHISTWYDDRFDTVHLLDNNILADEDWFFATTNYIIERDLAVREEGMDIRLLTPEIVQRLRSLKWVGMLHFAWDEPTIKPAVLRGIKMLKDGGFDTRRAVSIYVLTQYNTTRAQDLERVKVLRDLDVNPFVMVYGKPDKWHHKLQRVIGRKAIFWSDSWLDGLEVS